MRQKTKNRLSNNNWYHATTFDGWHSICRLGVLADFNKEISSDLDFGYGFYLTDTQEKAETYNSRLVDAGARDPSDSVIIEFGFIPYGWFLEGNFSTCVFEKHDNVFAEFVLQNRLENISGKKQHTYDIIYGVMSDGRPARLLAEYEMGKITRKELLEHIKKPNSMKQLSLHRQELCDILAPSRAYAYNVTNKCRKELDVSEYRYR